MIHKCQSQCCLSVSLVNMEETASTQFITETMKVSRSNSVSSLKSLTTLSQGQAMSQVFLSLVNHLNKHPPLIASR